MVEFYNENGHSHIPYDYNKDKALGRWVSTQRVSMKNGKMDFSRKQKLDELNFAWDMKGNSRL